MQEDDPVMRSASWPVQMTRSGVAPMIGECPVTRGLRTYIQQVATTDSTILITGETGTGKEVAAGLIHDGSRRRGKPFVHINCTAIPDTLLESELFGYERGAFTGALGSSEGKLKAGDGGTVLFDEIGDMSIPAQAKLLRVIESKEIERLGGRRSIPVDVRVIAATNQNLEQLMAEGRFRKDLYYRLNVIRIHLPPLRERRADVMALLDHYVDEFGRGLERPTEGFAEDAAAVLQRHSWPGNIRELRNLVEAVLPTAGSGPISLADLPPAYRDLLRETGTSGQADEHDRLLAALAATRWNKSKAAAELHWSRMTLYRKLAKYGVVESPRTA